MEVKMKPFADGRSERKNINRKRIEKWLKTNNGKVSIDKCSRDLGLSITTIYNHVKEIMAFDR